MPSFEQGKYSNEFSYKIHPNGFKVYSPPHTINQATTAASPETDIDITDEYAENDPYAFDMDSVFHQTRIESTMRLIGSVFDNNDTFKLLDTGCGKGYITNQIHKIFPKSEISAMDYSVSAIDYAFNNFSGIDFVVADAYNLPYTTGYFDVVVCNNIWEHVPDPLHMLKAIKRVLRQDGHLIISTPSRYRLGNILRILTRKPVRFVSKMHVTEYSVSQVTEQLKFGGFETIKIYSEKNYKPKNSIERFLVYGIIKLVLKLVLKYFKSPYSLESTCYFLAINSKQTGKS
jgi:2-polyprenyl-3-methyl-5-hydroxy-6-metoxy-1,4-benzoquinol methylase